MSRSRRKAPRSQHRGYRTRSRASRGERDHTPKRRWLLGGGLVALLAVLAAIFLVSRNAGSGEPDRPLGGIPVTQRNGYYSHPPEMLIDPSRDYRARIVTAKGEITLDLFEVESPIAVNNFVFLARQGFYDGVTFHRVLQDFMAQSGDPSGTGAGGPGYAFEDETDNGLLFDRPGLLAMANAGPNTNGSQFFITFVPTPHLSGRHTIFGEVVGGTKVLAALARRDPQNQPAFPGDLIERVIIEDDTSN